MRASSIQIRFEIPLPEGWQDANQQSLCQAIHSWLTAMHFNIRQTPEGSTVRFVSIMGSETFCHAMPTAPDRSSARSPKLPIDSGRETLVHLIPASGKSPSGRLLIIVFSPQFLSQVSDKWTSEPMLAEKISGLVRQSGNGLLTHELHKGPAQLELRPTHLAFALSKDNAGTVYPNSKTVSSGDILTKTNLDDFAELSLPGFKLVREWYAVIDFQSIKPKRFVPDYSKARQAILHLSNGRNISIVPPQVAVREYHSSNLGYVKVYAILDASRLITVASTLNERNTARMAKILSDARLMLITASQPDFLKKIPETIRLPAVPYVEKQRAPLPAAFQGFGARTQRGRVPR